MKITVIGGSFCPPTLAHLALSKSAKQAVQADLSLLVPAPFGYITMRRKNLLYKFERLSDETRIEMLNMMVRDENGIEVDNCAIQIGMPNRTLEELRTIKAKYPGADIYFVIGSDKLKQMNRWPTIQALLNEFYVLVTTRHGEDIHALISGCTNLAPFADRFVPFSMSSEWQEVSSSLVRELMRDEKYQEAERLLDHSVYEVLREIYGRGNEMSKDRPLVDITDGISKFHGDEYGFLSNFYTAEVTYKGLKFQNNEAAFQAQKVLDDDARSQFLSLEAGKAKRLGRKVLLRSDWESVKDGIMYEVVKAKFSQHPDLRDKLLATGETPLYEGNTWNDTYWGVCNGRGSNKLGVILMRVRGELRSGGD